MSTCLGLVLPVAGAAAKVALDASLTDSLEKQLELAQTTADFALQGSTAATDWLTHSDELATPSRDLTQTSPHSDLIRAQGPLLQEFHQFIRKADPSFGGLVRVQNKRQEFLWVHEQFVDQY